MKKVLLIAGCLTALSFGSISFADAAHPCKPLEVACKAAGFHKGGAPGKGLLKDCIKPLAEGQAVAGVTVTPEDAAACKVKVDAMSK